MFHSCWLGWVSPCLVVAVSLQAGMQAVGQEAKTGKSMPEASAIAEIRQADEQYAKARAARDFKLLANQWTAEAELTEGGKKFAGREAIVAYIRQLVQTHPTSQMRVETDQVRMLGDTLARVSGTIRMRESESARASWFTSRFESLRVKEEGVWRIASSTVEQVADASIEDLAWLAGAWRTTDKTSGQVIEASFEKVQGGKLLLGRMSTQGKDGKTIEVLQVLQADRRDGVIRCWLFESTGGRAQGKVEHDGANFNYDLTGVPPAGIPGERVESVQVMTPAGADSFTWHGIERMVDGVRIPDQKPLIFRRVR